jgi:hypothetical protein
MPRWLMQVLLRFRSVFRTQQVERELAEELQYHLEREVEERRAAGLSVEQARVPDAAWGPSRRTWRRVATCVE